MPASAQTTSFKKVTYTDADGCTYSKSGGSRSWRNNNPGNMKDGPFAQAHGSIGVDSGGFAIFPDYETGQAAMEDKLVGDYGDKSITTLIPIWAPASDGNDEQAYIDYCVSHGVDANQIISEMSDEQLQNLIDQMITYEGWDARTGTQSDYSCPNGSYKSIGTGAPAPQFQNHEPGLRPE